MGQDPLIDDAKFSSRLPRNVDEEAFTAGSAALPPPNEDSVLGNVSFFILRCRSVCFCVYCDRC